MNSELILQFLIYILYCWTRLYVYPYMQFGTPKLIQFHTDFYIDATLKSPN